MLRLNGLSVRDEMRRVLSGLELRIEARSFHVIFAADAWERRALTGVLTGRPDLSVETGAIDYDDPRCARRGAGWIVPHARASTIAVFPGDAALLIHDVGEIRTPDEPRRAVRFARQHIERTFEDTAALIVSPHPLALDRTPAGARGHILCGGRLVASGALAQVRNLYTAQSHRATG